MKKLRGIIICLTIIGLLLVMVGTFSYFYVSVNGTITGSTDNLFISLDGTGSDSITLNNSRGGIMPGDSGFFNLTLDMTGTDGDIIYDVNIRRVNLPNALNFYYDEAHIQRFVNCSRFIAQSSTMSEVIKIYWYWDPDVDDLNDSLFIGKKVSAIVDVNVSQQVYGEMKNGGDYTPANRTDFWSNTYSPYIKTVNFIDNIYSVPTVCNLENLCFDITGNDSKYPVYGYLIDSGYDNKNTSYIVDDPLYNLYIACEKQIYAPSISSSMFKDFVNLTNVNFNGNFNTSKIQFASYMFYGCSNLLELDLSDFNMGNCTGLYFFFYGCSSLKELDLSSLNTSKFDNLYCAFYGCSGLTSINFTNFNMSRATNMGFMFTNCSSLTELDVRFNTSGVINMRAMFQGCLGLKTLDVSSFDTKNVLYMDYMFANCSGLSSIVMNSFSMNKAEDAKYMFNGCSSLIELDLSGINASKCTDMTRMFGNCSSLIDLNMSNFDASSVLSMASMFSRCTKLNNLNMSGFKANAVTNMGNMFDTCSVLKSVDLSGIYTSKLTNMQRMFSGCKNIKNINVINFDTSNVTNMVGTFDDCYELLELNFGNFNTNSVTDMSYSFNDCTKLNMTITISGNVGKYTAAFLNAATNNSKITVNYISSASTLASNIIATKSSNSNVVKGVVVSL